MSRTVRPHRPARVAAALLAGAMALGLALPAFADGQRHWRGHGGHGHWQGHGHGNWNGRGKGGHWVHPQFGPSYRVPGHRVPGHRVPGYHVPGHWGPPPVRHRPPPVYLAPPAVYPPPVVYYPAWPAYPTYVAPGGGVSLGVQIPFR